MVSLYFPAPPPTQISTLSLHDALPICWFFSVQMIASTRCRSQFGKYRGVFSSLRAGRTRVRPRPGPAKNSSVSSPARPLSVTSRSEEHTSELQSRVDLVCRLPLEKKNE